MQSHEAETQQSKVDGPLFIEERKLLYYFNIFIPSWIEKLDWAKEQKMEDKW